MPRLFKFSLPGITCINCVQPVELALKNCATVPILSYSTDVIGKQIVITVSDNANQTDEQIYQLLKDTIEDIGVECVVINNVDNVIIEIPGEDLPLVRRASAVKRQPNRLMNWHIMQGGAGIASGLALMVLAWTGIAIPLFPMYVIVASSTLLTLALGAKSYSEAAKKLFKSKTLTMDALFAVSTLAVIVVSFLHFFNPMLPMMTESGLLIFGFGHIGVAVKESLQRKVTAKLAFKDRAPRKIEKQLIVNNEASWELTPTQTLRAGDVIQVRSGLVIPVDGVSLTNTYIDKTILTGRTAWIRIGDEVLAGMKVPDDVTHIQIRVQRPMTESYLHRLDERILQAHAEKAPLETITNKILQYFVPGVLLLAIMAGAAISFLFTPALGIQCAVLLMVSACPCILGLVTPLAIRMGHFKAMENGVKFRNGKSLQAAALVNTVVFDLNGTLTTGIPIVTSHQIYLRNSITPQRFFNYLALIEKHSQHAIAKAICRFLEDKLALDEEAELSAIDQSNHSGIRAKINDQVYLIGNRDFLRQHDIQIDEIPTVETAEQISYFVRETTLLGYVKTKDPLREDAIHALNLLKAQGKDIHLCTGADEETALLYAKELGIPFSRVYANCKGIAIHPDDRSKAKYIQELKQQHKIITMIGDGGNDAAALAASDVGFAYKSNSGDEMTQQEAGAIIDNTSLLPVVTAFAVANETVHNIKQNLLISLGYNIAVVLAAATFLISLGYVLSPGIGGALMIGQSSLVILNLWRISRRELPHLTTQNMTPVNHHEATDTYTRLSRNGLAPRPALRNSLLLSDHLTTGNDDALVERQHPTINGELQAANDEKDFYSSTPGL